MSQLLIHSAFDYVQDQVHALFLDFFEWAFNGPLRNEGLTINLNRQLITINQISFVLRIG